jgi:hypothetical protein
MLERCRGARSQLEAIQSLWVRREGGWQDLDGDIPPQACIPGAVDLSHAADPDGGVDLVGAEPCAGRKGHGNEL